ncbi:MAG: undecaprenyl-diphosphate phosphatase [Oscillospiraceae bacterium]|jgi:undecaprenyl-diphosphatase|nr:undecaprenyl-diphosphate phosphatase [Oscillospiraceae bacterium]
MTISDAIIQGSVQGLTEFLPISSSGHLAISQYFLGIKENNLFFNVALHLGTLLSILAVYHKIIVRLVVAFFVSLGNFLKGKTASSKDGKILLNLVLSCMPLWLMFFPIPKMGVKLKDFASHLADSQNLVAVGIALLVTSFLLFLGSRFMNIQGGHVRVRSLSEMTPVNAVLIGFAQLISAVFPGLSRSGTTLSAGLFCGVDRQAALDFSFIMAIPAIIAAFLTEFLKIRGSMAGVSLKIISTGVVTSAVVGFFSIIIFKWFLKKDKTWLFVVYTMALGIMSILIGI